MLQIKCSYFSIRALIFHLQPVDFWPLPPSFEAYYHSIFCKVSLSWDRVIWVVCFPLEKHLFCNFSETWIYAFNSIGCIHNLAKGTAVIKKLLDMVEISFPYINSSGILWLLLTKLLKYFSVPIKAWCPVYFFKRLCEFFVILAWHIFNWISN